MTGTSAAPGIIPRAISEIFSIIEATAMQEKDVFFYVRLSYVELYNNSFRNLLEFASKELSNNNNNTNNNSSTNSVSHSSTINDNSLNETANGNHSRSTSPTSLHPGINSRSDKIEVNPLECFLLDIT